MSSIWISTLEMMFDKLGVTLELFAVVLVTSTILGLVLALGCGVKWKPLTAVIRVYLLILRGTPTILQLMFFYYAPYYILGVTLPRFWAAVLALTLNYSAYACEVFRAGIESIPQGQYEAAQVLGFSKWGTYKCIIIPQVIKRIVPPYTSSMMTLIKDTSLAQVIGVVEIYRVATIQMAKYFATEPLIVAAIFYLVMNIVVERTGNYIEKKLDYYK